MIKRIREWLNRDTRHERLELAAGILVVEHLLNGGGRDHKTQHTYIGSHLRGVPVGSWRITVEPIQ